MVMEKLKEEEIEENDAFPQLGGTCLTCLSHNEVGGVYPDEDCVDDNDQKNKKTKCLRVHYIKQILPQVVIGGQY